jgi:hypothetical protein
MDSYWLSKASETESLLDMLRVEYAEMTRTYNERIADLERQLLEANLSIQTTKESN